MTNSAAARERLIVAIDVPDADSARQAASQLRGHVGILKIGLELFVGEGPAVVRSIREEFPELDIFLDLKLHDIPNTMRGAIRSARRLGARFLTVHAGSGIEHLQQCVEEAGDELQVLAVTVLTSQDEKSLPRGWAHSHGRRVGRNAGRLCPRSRMCRAGLQWSRAPDRSYSCS